MIKNINYLNDEEFEEVSQLFYNNFNEYIINYVMPDVIAFYLASRYMRNCLSVGSLKQHINSAIDIFNVRCNIDRLIPQIELILRIKYNLKIINRNKLRFKILEKS